jgi:spermidine synthase
MNDVLKKTGAEHVVVSFGFFLGLFATLSQVLVMREFLALPGIDELSMGMVLFSWLCFISVGAFLGKRIALSAGVMWGVSLLAAGMLPGSLLVVRFYETIFGIVLGAPPDVDVFMVLCVLSTLPAGVLSGYLFTGFTESLAPKSLTAIHFLYLGEGAGAAVAGPLYAFVLSETVSPLVAMGFCGVFLSLAVGIGQRNSPRIVRAMIPVVAASVCVGLFLCNVDDASFRHAYESEPARGEYLGCTETHYHRLCMGRLHGQFQLYRDGQVAYVFPEPFDRPGPVHLALAQHPHPRRVLLLGGGIANRLDAALRHHPESLHYLEFDPGELSFVAPRLDAVTQRSARHPAVRIHTGYNRSFLAVHPAQFDVIVQFTASPLTAAENADHTVEFYRAVNQALAPGGVFTVVSRGSANVASPPAAALVAGRARTLRQVFSDVIPVVDVETYFFAGNGAKLVTGEQILAERLNAIDPRLVYASRVVDIFAPLRLARSRQLIAATAGDVNRDGHPRTFLHTLDLQRWIRQSAVGAATLANADWRSDSTDRNRHWGAVVSAGLLVLAGLLSAIRRPRRLPAEAISVATTGMCGLGLEVILIYWYSVTHGGVYHHIAWLLSEFMFGLAVGALIGHHIGNRRGMCLVADLSVVLVLLATSLAVSGVAAFPLPTAPLMILAGSATGFAFPVFLDRISAAVHQRAVPLMVAADHLGAAAGALLVSVVWIPWFGLDWTCVLLLIFKVPLMIKYSIQKC